MKRRNLIFNIILWLIMIGIIAFLAITTFDLFGSEDEPLIPQSVTQMLNSTNAATVPVTSAPATTTPATTAPATTTPMTTTAVTTTPEEETEGTEENSEEYTEEDTTPEEETE